MLRTRYVHEYTGLAMIRYYVTELTKQHIRERIKKYRDRDRRISKALELLTSLPLLPSKGNFHPLLPNLGNFYIDAQNWGP